MHRPVIGSMLARTLRFSLHVRLDEPQPLVSAARDLRQDIGGIGVLELVCLLYGVASAAPERGERRRERVHMGLTSP